MVVALTRRHWADLLAVTKLAGAAAALEKSLDVDFTSEGERFEYRESLAGLLSRWFAQADMAEVKSALADTSVLWSTYNTFADVVTGAADGAGIGANPMMHLIDQPGIGQYLAPGLPVALDGAPPVPAPAPALGEHTDGVLGRLGLSDGKIADLHRRGIVRGSSE
jgi:2-methylfumaryl-CoA isomerase